MSTVDLLLKRRSVLVKEMQEPGPNQEQIETILRTAHRVPDHGKIGPWKFIVFQGDARLSFGKTLEEIYKQENPEAKPELLEFQRNIIARAPVVIAVASTPDTEHKVPVWEQELSAGAACQNILITATAMGFGAQWITEWYSFNQDVNKALGLNDKDRIAGFIYIGSYENPPKERVRPELSERVVYWK